jgi:hypothetical protein
MTAPVAASAAASSPIRRRRQQYSANNKNDGIPPRHRNSSHHNNSSAAIATSAVSSTGTTTTHPYPTKETIRVRAGRGCAQADDGVLESSVGITLKLNCKEEPMKLQVGKKSPSLMIFRMKGDSFIRDECLPPGRLPFLLQG